jgi:ABC-type amino acid transport substrate-binding protein
MYRIAKSRQIALRAVVDVMGVIIAAQPYPVPRQGSKEQLPGVAQELQQRHKQPHQTFHCCFVGDHEVAVYVVGTVLVPFWQGFFPALSAHHVDAVVEQLQIDTTSIHF